MTHTSRDLFDLTGRVALITGSAGILGPEFAAALGAYGARVAMTDRDEEACHRAAQAVREETGAEVLPLKLDVADEAAVARVVAEVHQAFGEIGILINAAASKSPGYFRPLVDYDRSDWEHVLAANLTGMFLVTKHVVPHLIAKKRGTIINIASMYGVVGPDPSLYVGSWYLDQEINTPPIYAATKAGVLGFTRHLATTLAVHGIRANAVSPGGVESGQNETFLSRYAERSPIGRMARREELRGPIVFLASDASSYMTGHNLVVDGGWTIR
jgi:NAD(P)-dependent dehydrogenase (short-subunit alcohol dehydrogenase family)